MPPPTTSWFCDACKRPIGRAEDGILEWLGHPVPTGKRMMCRGFRIVHAHRNHRGGWCNYDPHRPVARRDDLVVGDDSLTGFLGHDGLIRLLEMIAERNLYLPEVLEVIKRLHVPGYEQALRHSDAALEHKVVTHRSTLGGYWSLNELDRILAFAETIGERGDIRDQNGGISLNGG